MLAIKNKLNVRRHLFQEFLSAYLLFYFPTLCYSDILFVAFVVPFNYEDQRLTQH